MQSVLSDLDDDLYAAGDVGLYRGIMVTVCKFDTSSVKLRIVHHIELNEVINFTRYKYLPECPLYEVLKSGQ